MVKKVLDTITPNNTNRPNNISIGELLACRCLGVSDDIVITDESTGRSPMSNQY